MGTDKQTLDSLIFIQKVMGELDYTLAGDNSYYKDYGLMDGTIIRIMPKFDRGISLDTRYQLCSINLSNAKVIPVVEGQDVPLNHIPRECMDDVTNMLAQLAPQCRMPLRENFVITSECNICNKTVSSFIHVDGVTECLDCFSREAND